MLEQKKLGFGTMRLPITDANDPGSVDIEQFKRMVDVFLERGFCYFDTAWPYCDEQSECAIKEALVDRYPRDRFMLTDKLPTYVLQSKEDRDRILNEQIAKTGVSYFDYYFLHNVNAGTVIDFKKYDCFHWIKTVKERGLAKHIGFSYHDGPELLDEILTEYPEFEVVQLQLNYLDWDSLGVQSRKCYEVCVKHGKPVIVMEPVKGGTLAKVPAKVESMLRKREPDMSVPSWAIRFAASLENVKLVLSGMSNMEQLLDNTSYMEHFQPLTAEETELLNRAADMINQQIAIACTGCSYCTVGCPKNIAIPRYFSLYNADLQEIEEKGWSSHGMYYENLTLRYGRASDCIKCGNCERHCPQHLPIRAYLTDVAKRFEG